MNFPNFSNKEQDTEQLVKELKECWNAYQEIKQKTDVVSQRSDIPPELIGTINQVAPQHLMESVRNVLLKHTGIRQHQTKEQKSTFSQSTEQTKSGPSEPPPHPEKKSKYLEKKMYRVDDDKMLAGVCGGLADYFNVDSNIIRVIFVVTSFAPVPFLGLVAYVALAVVLPLKTLEGVI